jgi:ABC-type multidrug transport system permease subunit
MPDRSHPLVELTLMRLREFLREPEALFWVFAFPVMMALALGIAFREQGPKPIPVGVVRAAGHEAVVAALAADRALVVRLVEPAEIDRALRNGAVHVVVFAGTPPRFRFDPSRPESRVARLAADAALQRAAGRRDVWQASDDEIVTPGSRYIDWLLPGLLGMNIMGTGLWSTGFAIVNARVRKLLKRFTATPMRRGHYLLSNILARLLFLALEVVAVLGFGWLVFRVPFNGSLVTLAFFCLLGALSFGGLGLLLASRANTVEAVSGLLNVAMLPMWILSGVFFSSENFPAVMQPLINALPLTALNQGLRGVMIDGLGVAALWRQIAVLAAWGVGCYVTALRLFRWR